MDPVTAAPPPRAHTSRIDALDGMRAYAVLTVLAYHYFAVPKPVWDPLRATGGFLSLDVFFVLSGFLITGLLLKEVDRRGRISFRSFYARRALRLFPALAVVIIVAVTASLLWPGQDWSHPTLEGLPWVLLYVGNWWVVVYGRALPLGALHTTWSLAVEEQFYLLWPLLLTLVIRRRPNRSHVAALLAALTAGVMVYRLVAIEVLGWAPRDRVFFGTDTHCDGLLAGCALAFYLSSRQDRPWSERAGRRVAVAAGAGTVVLIGCAWRLSYVHPYSYWIGIPVAVVATVLIILSLHVRPLPVLSHALAWRPAVWVGRRSYGIYLWQPIVTTLLSNVDTHGLTHNEVIGGEFVTTLVLAALSYRVVEKPFLRRKRNFERATIGPAAFAAAPGAA